MAQTSDDGNYTALLSPLDQIMPRIYTRMFLVFQVSDHDQAVGILQESLDRTVSLLPYTCGRIFSGTGECSSPSQLFLKWSAHKPFLKLEHVTAPEGFPCFEELERQHAPLHLFTNSLASVPARIAGGIPGAGIKAVVANYTSVPGGLVLCVAVHHALMDGTGMSAFIRLWADCAKGLVPPTPISVEGQLGSPVPDPEEPLFRAGNFRELGNPFMETPLEDLAMRHPELRFPSIPSPHPFDRWSSLAPFPDHLPECTSKIITFSGPMLEQAKAILTAFGTLPKLTVHGILTAIIWSSITRARLLRRFDSRSTIPPVAPPPDDVTSQPVSRLGFPVDLRPRLRPGSLSHSVYTGNANPLTVADVPISRLLEAAAQARAPGTGEAAGLRTLVPIIEAVAASTASVTGAYVGELMALVDRTAVDLENLAPGWWSFHGLDFSCTSWGSLGLHECDFGPAVGGTPKFVRMPFVNHVDGSAYVLPRRRRSERETRLNERGGSTGGEKIEVVIMLNAANLQDLESDEVLQSWLVRDGASI